MTADRLALEALMQIKATLVLENEKGAQSAITNTIWHGPGETLFDYIDNSIAAVTAAQAPAEGGDLSLLAARSATAIACLPDAPYKAALQRLHADMLAAAQAPAEGDRAAFEAWTVTFYGGLATAADTWDEQRRTYTDYAHHMAWCLWRSLAARPDVQPKGAAEPVAEVRATGANSCELFFLPAGSQLKPGDKLYTGPAQAPAPAPEPHGWIVWWPAMGGGHKPVYTHGAQKPSYGPDLGSKLRLYPVYDAAPAPAVVDELREELAAAEKSVSVYMAERNQARDRVRELRARIDAAERDAARYRFIRDADRSDDFIRYDELASLSMDSLDRAIDTAMKQEAAAHPPVQDPQS